MNLKEQEVQLFDYIGASLKDDGKTELLDIWFKAQKSSGYLYDWNGQEDGVVVNIELERRLFRSIESSRGKVEDELASYLHAVVSRHQEYCNRVEVNIRPELIRDSSWRTDFESAERVAEVLDSAYLKRKLNVLKDALGSNPDLAVGTAKEFLESVCKTVLDEKSISYDMSGISLPALVKKAVHSVDLIPSGTPSAPKFNEALRTLVNNLGSCVQQLAYIRNNHGSGHGKSAASNQTEFELQDHHARFVVDVSLAITGLIFDCWDTERAYNSADLEGSANAQSSHVKVDSFAEDYDPFAEA